MEADKEFVEFAVMGFEPGTEVGGHWKEGFLAAWSPIKLSQQIDAWKIKADRRAEQAPPLARNTAPPEACAT
jgi:hypothetical protein